MKLKPSIQTRGAVQLGPGVALARGQCLAEALHGDLFFPVSFMLPVIEWSEALWLSASMQFILRTLVVVGNTLTLVGCLGLALGAIGIFNLETFAVGISSGVRVIGTVAIAGALISAIGYGIVERQDD